MRKLYLLLVMTMALSLSSAALAEGDTYWTDLGSLNGSEASGHAKVMVDGNQLTVTIESHGVKS